MGHTSILSLIDTNSKGMAKNNFQFVESHLITITKQLLDVVAVQRKPTTIITQALKLFYTPHIKQCININ